jgi:DNA repair exonuclease SbcCD ATPase subunit
MKCERLTLVNFCNHPYRVIDFNSGTTAIIGPNGSGKSHIMGGIRFALTGENPNVGTKTANIYDLIPAGENSFVELVFSHGGVTATVRRNIKPARPTAVLTINNGAEVIEGDNEVTARIQRIVGITTDILNEIVIVGQEEIFGFLDKTPAKRAEQFQRLFQTEQAAVIYKIIGDQLKTVQIPEVGVDRDQLVISITAATDAEQRTTQQLQGYPTFEEIQIGRQQNVDVVTAYNSRAVAEQELLNSQTQRTAASNGHGTATANLTKLTTERGVIAESLARSEAPAESARLALANLIGARQRADARSRLSNRLTALQQQLDAAIAQAPVKPENYTEDITSAEKTYSAVSVALAEHQRLVNSFTGQLSACPTCGTPVAAFHDKIDAASQAIPQLSAQLQTLRSTIDRSRDYNTTHQLHQTTVAGLQGQVNSVNQQLLDSPHGSRKCGRRGGVAADGGYGQDPFRRTGRVRSVDSDGLVRSCSLGRSDYCDRQTDRTTAATTAYAADLHRRTGWASTGQHWAVGSDCGGQAAVGRGPGDQSGRYPQAQ